MANMHVMHKLHEMIDDDSTLSKLEEIKSINASNKDENEKMLLIRNVCNFKEVSKEVSEISKMSQIFLSEISNSYIKLNQYLYLNINFIDKQLQLQLNYNYAKLFAHQMNKICSLCNYEEGDVIILNFEKLNETINELLLSLQNYFSIPIELKTIKASRTLDHLPSYNTVTGNDLNVSILNIKYSSISKVLILFSNKNLRILDKLEYCDDIYTKSKILVKLEDCPKSMKAHYMQLKKIATLNIQIDECIRM